MGFLRLFLPYLQHKTNRTFTKFVGVLPGSGHDSILSKVGVSTETGAVQPYEQLSALYLLMGQESSGREVRIARQRDMRKLGELQLISRVWNLLLDVLIGFGYRPWRALALLLVVLIATGAVLTSAGSKNGLMPTRANATPASAPTSSTCTTSYPCFSGGAYAVDIVVPLINLRQAEFWQPDTRTIWGELARYVGWAGTIFGWLLSSITAAAVSGLIRRD